MHEACTDEIFRIIIDWKVLMPGRAVVSKGIWSIRRTKKNNSTPDKAPAIQCSMKCEEDPSNI
jgi:hypothetical protein